MKSRSMKRQKCIHRLAAVTTTVRIHVGVLIRCRRYYRRGVLVGNEFRIGLAASYAQLACASQGAGVGGILHCPAVHKGGATVEHQGQHRQHADDRQGYQDNAWPRWV
jgi:hypothetical protein